MAVKKLVRTWGNIAFDDDIILNVAERTGCTVKQVQVVFNFIFWFIKKDIKDPNKHSIMLPHLGLLYYKVDQARHRKEFLKKFVSENGGTSAMRARIKRMEEQIENFDNYYNSIAQGRSIYSVHKIKRMFNMRCYRRNLPLEELEIYLNNQP